MARVALPVPIDELFDYAVPPALAAAAQPGCRVRVRLRRRPLVGVIVERSVASAFGGRLALARAADRPRARALVGAARRAARGGGGMPVPDRHRARRGAARGLGAAQRARLRAHAPGPRGARRDHVRGARAAAARPARARPRARGGAAPRAGSPRLRARARRCKGSRATASSRLRARAGAAGPGGERAGGAARARRRGARGRRARARAGPGRAARAPRARGRRQPCASSSASSPARRRGCARSRRAASSSSAGARRRATCSANAAPPSRRPRSPPSSRTPSRRSRTRSARWRCETFLLHGVTGSGKTEVYLHAIAEALAHGRQALVLVPEITLTHQILARLRGRFGDVLAVLHSGLSPGERLEQWQRLRDGATPIAVGARSALFAPLEKLGVIVIDEEHDSAYKNEEGFRYHARELAGAARRRGGLPAGARLGDAVARVPLRGRPRRRCAGWCSRAGSATGRCPRCEIVDLVRERELAPRGRRIVLSGALERALARDARRAAGRASCCSIAAASRRRCCCFACGAAERCRHCDIALVYHATPQRLRCHYCDFSIAPPERCSQCGAPGHGAARHRHRAAGGGAAHAPARGAHRAPRPRHRAAARLHRARAARAARAPARRPARNPDGREGPRLPGRAAGRRGARGRRACTCPTSAPPSAPSSCSRRWRAAPAATARRAA